MLDRSSASLSIDIYLEMIPENSRDFKTDDFFISDDYVPLHQDEGNQQVMMKRQVIHMVENYAWLVELHKIANLNKSSQWWPFVVSL